MTALDQHELARRRYLADQVLTASAEQRLLMLYERALGDLCAAEAGFEAGSIEAIHDSLLHAQRIVLALHDTLSGSEWPAAQAMRAVHRFVHERLVQCNITKDRSLLPLCVDLLTRFYEANSDAASRGSAVLEGAVGAR